MMRAVLICLLLGACGAVHTKGDCNIKITKITEVQCRGSDNEYKSIIIFPQQSPHD